jgi:hypothetical protein
VATKNSGTETIATVRTLTARSYAEPRVIAVVMPKVSATGTETAAVTDASNSEFGRRLPISAPTESLLTSERPGLPATSPASHCR